MIKPFTIGIEKEEKSSGFIPDFSKNIDTPIFASEQDTSTTKKKRRSSKKDQGPLFTSPSHMIQAGESFVENDKSSSKRELSIMESNEPIDKKYTETNNILRSAIVQLDNSMAQVQEDIDYVRHSKTLRNKYQYLSLLQGSMGSMIANKIAAARELNNTIAKCTDFEVKRYKETRAAAAANNDDDQRVMEMYRAFVNTPVSSNPFPNISQMAVGGSHIVATSIGNQDDNYSSYINNMTPQQQTMYLEDNPNIKQVVVYNQETGARYFDVIDMTTGQSIPNAEKHDMMFLEDVTIDLKNRIARNVNIGETYPLVVVGEPIMQEY